MTDHAYSPAHGSTTHRGTPVRPLAEQVTEVVPLDEHEVPYDDSYDVHDSYGDSYDDPYDVPYEAPYDPAGSARWAVEPAYPQDDRTDPGDHLLGTDGLDSDVVDQDEDDGYGWSPAHGTGPVAVRRADTVAGLLLLLAGMAAGVSVLLVWVHGGATGLDLVRDGLHDAASGAAALAGTGSWQPLAVVGGGIGLFGLGLLMYVPAKTHRLLGALALLVSLVVAAGVLVPLADARWDLDRLAVGAWFTVAVGGLGLLGGLKGLSTNPRHR